MAESSAIAAIGSKLKILPANGYQAWPAGLQLSTSADGASWAAWADVQINGHYDILYPGYFKIRTASVASIRFYNAKTPDEADSLTGNTVIIGGVSTS